MWKFLKDHRGQKFSHNGKTLWHNINRTREETVLAKKVSKAVNLLRQHVISEMNVPEADSKKWIDGDWEKGVVFLRQNGSGRAIRLFDKARGEDVLHVSPEASQSEINFDFKSHLNNINDAK